MNMNKVVCRGWVHIPQVLRLFNKTRQQAAYDNR